MTFFFFPAEIFVQLEEGMQAHIWDCWHPTNLSDQQSFGLTQAMQKFQSNADCSILNLTSQDFLRRQCSHTANQTLHKTLDLEVQNTSTHFQSGNTGRKCVAALPLHHNLGRSLVRSVNAAIPLSLAMHRNIPVNLLKERGCKPVVTFIRHECRNVLADGRSTVQSGLLPTIHLKRALNPLTGLRLFTHFALKVCIFSV